VKKVFLAIIIIISVVLIFLLGRYSYNLLDRESDKALNIPHINIESSKPLNVYTIKNLSDIEINAGNFELGKPLSDNEDFESFVFTLTFKPNPQKEGSKNTTGQINIPATSSRKPVIIMLRGYVDQEIYTTGMGTSRVSDVFAENGFITVAPDFLGYADSDSEAANIFESRFQTYVTVLSLIKSLDQIDDWDERNLFLWGHSNGGQIALTVLEITGREYPTTLWAPVSKPFPYSILYYTDESEDRGKLIRTELAKFEKDYDVELYSLDMYFDLISAPVQIHQGTADDAVPLAWTNNLQKQLSELDIDLKYFTYPGADHNMRPNWNTVVARDLEFFTNNTK